MKVTLQPGEVEIDTWTLLYVPPGGGKYNGKLTVTNRRLLYDAKFDVSVKGMLAEALFIKWGSEGYLEIDKGSIQARRGSEKAAEQEMYSDPERWQQAHVRLRGHEHR